MGGRSLSVVYVCGVCVRVCVCAGEAGGLVVEGWSKFIMGTVNE